jgi:hypothetical protein
MDRDTILNWLLEEDNPPVRLLTLTRLLGRPETDAEVQEARARLMEYPVTQNILAHSDEIWQSGPRALWSYKGKHWNTVYLGSFLADGQDPRIAEGVQELIQQRGWVWSNCFQCMTACMLTAFRRLGYGEHPIVAQETEALAQRTLDEGGIACREVNNSLLSHCYMALPKLLLCFGEVPPEERSPATQAAIDWIVAELLANQVYIYVPGNSKAWHAVRKQLPRKRTDLPEGETRQSWRAKAKARFLAEQGMGERQPKPSWTRFGFPLNYNSDALETMVALATAGTSMDAPTRSALEKPLQLIRDKHTTEGVWRMEKSLNGQMWADVEVKGEPSKWITYFALLVLDHFEENK